jgi:hypothetical protein
LNDRHGFFVQQFISREKAKAAAATLPPLRVIIPHVVGNEILIGVPALISDWCVCECALPHSFAQPPCFRSRLYLLKKYFTRARQREIKQD